MTEHEKAEEMATAYALERSPTVQCPACGEETHWPHHKEDWLAGFRAAESAHASEPRPVLELLSDMKAENARLIKALEYYAAGGVDLEPKPGKAHLYDQDYPRESWQWLTRSMSDYWNGKLARETLKSIKGESK